MCEMICVLVPHALPVGTLISSFCSVLCLFLPWNCGCPSLHVSTCQPISSPYSCPQGPKQPVMAVLLGKRPTSSPGLAQRSGEAGAPLRGRQVGDPRALGGRQRQGLGGPPRAGETRWLVEQHTPDELQAGQEGEGTPGPPGPSGPPQGGPQPSGHQQPLSLHGRSPPAACPGLELF